MGWLRDEVSHADPNGLDLPLFALVDGRLTIEDRVIAPHARSSTELVALCMQQRHNATMATIQIRDVPEDVHRTLRSRAAANGQSLQEYLLEELTDLAGATKDIC